MSKALLSSNPLSASLLFWRVKLRIALNYLLSLQKHFFIHLIVGVFVVGGLLCGGLIGFSFLFNWLLGEERQPFGDPMLRRLIGMVLLAFSSMLTFSNLIIMLTTSYISREVEFFMGQPISHRRLFFCKFAESTLYSSWAFIVLSFPFFLALGGTKTPDEVFSFWTVIPDAPWIFYPITGLLLIPYVVIPAALGAMIALLITTYFPSRRMFRLAFAIAGVTVLLGIIMGKQAGMGLKFGRGEKGEIGRVMSFMGIGDIAWMPSTWFSRGIRAGMNGDAGEAFFWGCLLFSTALLALQICYDLAGPLYYRGFCLTRAYGTSLRKREGGLFFFFDRMLRPIPARVRALMTKDLSVFWRDPAQWGQLMVLFGLLFLYVANLGSAADLGRVKGRMIFKSLTSLFNIGATSFVLGIISTRFIFPMLSLEGKQQWVIGLAPLPRTRLVWIKFGLSVICSLGLSLPLILLSCFVLQTDLFITMLSICTICVLSVGLSSLAIGLGAYMPNFQEDNPARIANGLGGTINVIISLIYIAATLALETPWIGVYLNQSLPRDSMSQLIFFGSIPAIILLQGIVIATPMVMGLRHWRRLEF